MSTIADVPMVDPDRTLGDLVTERPARARILERAGIDYCCHGQRSLLEATEADGLDTRSIAIQLAAVTDDAEVDIDQLDPPALVDHIVDTHHAYLHEELPLVDALATKVRDVHRTRHPELDEVARLVHEIRADLEPHLAKEEQVLFPAIHAMAEGETSFPFGSVANPIRVMLVEHDQAGELLRQLRSAAQHYVTPDDACASYSLLYERLAHLEADTHRHIHLENNVLFTAVTGDTA